MSVAGRQSLYSRLASNEAVAGHELSTLGPQAADTKSPVQNTESLLVPGSSDRANSEGTGAPIDTVPVKRVSGGWQVGAVTGASLPAVTLVINVAALVYQKKTDSESLVEVFQGDCKRVKDLQIWGHLLINALSAILLAASNYSMQVLSAPRPADVDRMHKKGKWLDIGVQSPRNLSHIAPWRAALWWVLCLSSVPLHLLYSSKFYASTAARSYEVYLMTPSYASYTADQGLPPVIGRARDDAALAQHIEDLIQLPKSSERVERLGPAACLNAYAHVVTTDCSNLIIVTKNETESSNASAVIKDEA